MTANTMPSRPSRLMVFGYKRHGKDASCEYIERTFGLSFKSSSYFACETFLFEQMRETHGYASIDECFEDRVNHREYWYNAIRDYNNGDRCRLGRGIFESHPIYCGIRDREEFETLRAEGMFDLAIWIDASDRLPPEDASSMNLNQADADIVVSNNGTLEQLHQNIDNLFAMLGFVPLADLAA